MRAVRVCSVCSGALILAATGLLDGRRAVTHWEDCEALAAQLRQEKAILGVFDEGCMGMFNAIIPDHYRDALKWYQDLAFEDGTGSSHVPACCNNYVRLDMSKWF